MAWDERFGATVTAESELSADDLGVDGDVRQRVEIEGVLLDAEGHGAHAHQVECVFRLNGRRLGHAGPTHDVHMSHQVLGNAVVDEIGIGQLLTCKFAQLVHMLRGGDDLTSIPPGLRTRLNSS